LPREDCDLHGQDESLGLSENREVRAVRCGAFSTTGAVADGQLPICVTHRYGPNKEEELWTS
jgi:hypothetical protein